VAIAEKLGINHSFRLDFDFEREDDGLFRFASKWIVLTRADVSALKQQHEKWVKLLPSTQALWTDDYSDIFGALNMMFAMRSQSTKGTEQ